METIINAIDNSFPEESQRVFQLDSGEYIIPPLGEEKDIITVEINLDAFGHHLTEKQIEKVEEKNFDILEYKKNGEITKIPKFKANKNKIFYTEHISKINVETEISDNQKFIDIKYYNSSHYEHFFRICIEEFHGNKEISIQTIELLYEEYETQFKNAEELSNYITFYRGEPRI